MVTSQTSTSTWGIGGEVKTWKWQQPYQIVYEVLGQGEPVLLLPALSTVSSRSELRTIAAGLAKNNQVFALDWQGFGESDCPPIEYNPVFYQQLLQDFVANIAQPIRIIAAGHASGYALKLASQQPQAVSKIVLIAPTWCGPLRVMGLPRLTARTVKNLVRLPLLGQLLYFLNTRPAFLKLMYSRHVYTNKDLLTPEFIRQKWQITHHDGARFGPAAFVTGNLDPVTSQDQFLQLFESVSVPVLTIIAQDAPPASLHHMQAVQQIDKIKTVTLPGTLGMYEEYAEEVLEEIISFLDS